jgi:hypothetical protein
MARFENSCFKLPIPFLSYLKEGVLLNFQEKKKKDSKSGYRENAQSRLESSESCSFEAPLVTLVTQRTRHMAKTVKYLTPFPKPVGF